MSDQQKRIPILSVSTAQTTAFKQVVERIQNVISDCCLVFVPPDDDNDENITDDYYESDEIDNP